MKSIKFILKQEGVLLSLLYFFLLYNVMLPLSTPAVILFCFVFILGGFKVSRQIDNTGLLILLYTITFIFGLYYNDSIHELSSLLLYSIPPIIFYCFGRFTIDRLQQDNFILMFIILTIIFFSGYIYILTISNIVSSGAMINMTRELSSDGDASIAAATLVGLNVSLGMIGLPLFLFINKKNKLIRYLGLFCFVLSIISVVFLINRTGIVVALAVLIVSTVYYSRHCFAKIVLYLGLFFIIYLFLTRWGIISQEVIDAYTERNVGLNSGGDRFWRWGDALGKIFSYPMGWSKTAGTFNNYVHNMWLDVARSAGIIPFFLLVSLTIRSIKDMFALLKHSGDDIALCFLMLNVSILTTSMVEPVMEGIPLYFYLYLMIMGMQRQYRIIKKV